jgi:type II secretory pathway pseudopilin PulG
MDERAQPDAADQDQTTGILLDPVASIACTHCGAVIDTAGRDPFSVAACSECGHTETVPGRLGPFLLLSLIGTGGMGGVYRARDEALGRYVAIKVMLASVGRDAEFVETFRREAQAAARLNHPHIAQIYSFGQERDQPYIVMELVTGKGLNKLMETGAPLDQALVMEIGLDIAKGLKEADAIGLIHGDIKPENILLDEKMNAKLVDFGIATYVSQTQPEGIWGTPYYIAPEKVTRQPAGAHSDIYSLGATLFHALANRPPFEGDTPVAVVKARLENPAPPLQALRPDIHEGVASIIARMLQAEPGMRYPTYASLISDMRKILPELGPSPRKTGRLPGAKGRRVVIKTKGRMRLTGPVSGAGGALTAAADAGGEDAAPQAETAEAAEARRRARRAALKTVVWIALLAALAGGAIWGWTRYQARQRAEEQRLRDALTLASTRRQAGEAFAALTGTVKTLGAHAQAARALATEATNSVALLLGMTLEIPEVRLEDVLPSLEPTTEPEVEPDTPADEPALRPEAETEAEAAPVNPPAEPAAETEAGGEPAPDLEPAPKPTDAAPLARAAMRVINGAVSLRGDALRAGHIQLQTRGALDRVNAAPDNAAARPDAAAIAAALEQTQDLARGAERTLRETEEAARDTATLRREMEREAAEKSRREQEERLRRAREAEAQQREAEQQQNIADELARVDALRAANADLLRAHNFADAVNAASAARATFETPEGRRAIRTVQERYALLDDMKAFLVTQLQTRPFRWGWGWGAAATDVLGATDRHIAIRGRQVPWSEVDAAQMLKFLNHYLLDPDLGLRAKARHNLAAAVYCREVVGTEAARRAAREYAEKAVTLLPPLADDAERLVPAE